MAHLSQVGLVALQKAWRRLEVGCDLQPPLLHVVLPAANTEHTHSTHHGLEYATSHQHAAMNSMLGVLMTCQHAEAQMWTDAEQTMTMQDNPEQSKLAHMLTQ